jgi:protein O-GlcNAc transferase
LGAQSKIKRGQVDRSQIEEFVSRGEHSRALKGLTAAEPSAWRDTAMLRCLRAVGHVTDAIAMANKLFQALQNDAPSYLINTSERNHQLRYIALVFAEQRQAEQACEILHELVSSRGGIAALHREYGFAFASNGQLENAEEQLNLALTLEPKNANTYAQLARLYCRTGRIREGYDSYTRAATLEPNDANHIQQMTYWANYCENITQENSYRLARLWADQLYPKNKQKVDGWQMPSTPDRRLKLAFVSSNFCAHALSFFVLPLLKGLNHDDFEVVAYSDTKKTDGITTSIRNLCDRWKDSSRLSDRKLALQIKEDRIDILIDLNGHSIGSRLAIFAEHSAPIQISWLGYPSTTGLKSMTYRISDRIADPVGVNETFYTEKLIRLSNGFVCYQPLESAPNFSPRASAGGFRFGSFNNLAKISAQTLDAWAAALHAVADSTLYLKRGQLSNENTKHHLINAFATRGINKDRLILSTSNAKIEQHLDQYNDIDIALDSLPYNGMTTTLEALWMGVPVLTLIGKTHAGRISASILQRLNLGSLVCKDIHSFAERAQQLSENSQSLYEIKSGLRRTMQESAVMNYQQFAYEFGSALRKTWHSWCEENNSDQPEPAEPVTPGSEA